MPPTNHPFTDGLSVVPPGTRTPTFAVDRQGNTYIAGQVRIVSGTQWAFYAQDGDVYIADRLGIGTPNPAYKLHVADTRANQPQIVVRQGDEGSTYGLFFQILSTDVAVIDASGSSGIPLHIRSGGVTAISISTNSTQITINDGKVDMDVVIRSDETDNHFYSDAGSYSGVGSFGFGTAGLVANPSAYLAIDPPALSPGSGNDFYRQLIANTGAVTIAGTPAVVASLGILEPNLAGAAPTLATTVYIGGAPTEGSSNYALYVGSGTSRFGGRVNEGQGATLTSANTLTLGDGGNVFALTGTTQINLITSTGWLQGAKITLRFAGNTTVAHNQAATLATAPILMASAGSYLARANSLTSFVLCSNGVGVYAWVHEGN